jgi:D-3-phosphoglycerate dehydrogenase
MPHVLITDSRLPAVALENVLVPAGLSFERVQCVTEEEVIEAGGAADALIVTYAPITDRVLATLPGVRFVSRLGIGFDTIDVDAAAARGIPVANVPDYCIEDVAAHALAHLLGLVRGIPRYDRAVRAGRWSYLDAAPRRLTTLTLAVVGCGRIGSLVCRQASALGFRVLGVDPYVDVAALGVEPATLEEALVEADAVTLHVLLNRETRHLLDAAALALLRPTAVVVNTSRGAVIDQAALVEALQAGRLAGAGLDVAELEPLPADSPLLALENVTLTPHTAFYSPESLAELPRRAAPHRGDFFAGRPVASIVNAP